jgi:hypothetical protein
MMQCPSCGSDEISVACCGDSTATCARCGHRWDSGVITACPLPTKPTKPVEPKKRKEPRYVKLDDNQLWGD